MKSNTHTQNIDRSTRKEPQRTPLIEASIEKPSTKSRFYTALSRPGPMWHCGVLMACVGAFAADGSAFAQTSFIFSSPVSVGRAPSIQSVSVTIQSGGTVGAVEVLTQGSPNLDFISSGGGTCFSGTYTPGQVCGVSVAFAPKYPGTRFGAVVVLADDGHIMASQGLSGEGTGSLSVMARGEINTLAGDGCLSDGACLTGGGTPATNSALNLPDG